MMKKSLFFAGLAAALCLVGCNKETDVKGLDGRPVEIVLSDVATRTVNDGMSTKWVNGDALNVFYAPAGTTEYSSNVEFKVDDAENNHAKGTAELTADAYDWYLLYPYSKYVTTPANTDGRIYIGSRSDYTQKQAAYGSKAHLAGGDAISCFPVYGLVKNVSVSATPVVEMKQVASVLAVNVKNESGKNLTIEKVSFTAPEFIVGNFFIDFAQEPLSITAYETQASKTAEVEVTESGVLANGETATLYMGIKPFTAKSGSELSLKVTADQGVFEKTITLPADVQFKSGYIKQINVSYTSGTAIPSSTLAEITAMENNTDVQTNEVLVVAKYARGIMLAENGSYLLAFNNNGVTGEIGDIVTVSGKVGEYAGLKQIASPEVTVISSDNEVVLPEPKVLETLDEYASDKVELIQYTGTLAVSGNYFNVNVTGSTRLGSIQYPIDTDALKALDKKVVTATGFFTGITGSSTKYVNMMSTSVEEATVALFGVESEEINVPATATSADIKVTGNVDWTVTPGDGILSVEPLSGTGAGTVKVTFAANTTAEPKEYSVTIGTTADVEDDEKFVTIIQAAASTEAKTYPYTEAFDNGQGDFSIDDVNKPADLSYVWTADTKNHYMKASAYKNPTNYASESWLVSPVVDLKDATAPALSFTHATNFFSSVDKAKEEATVWAREEGGSWTALEGVNYPASLSWTFVESGSIDLSAYKGKKIQIAFKYTSTETKAGTWEIKNFKLDEAVTGPVDPTFTAPETLSVEVGKTAKINVTTNSDGAVTYASSNTAVATVAEDGTVTGVAAGTANVTVSAAATANFNAASATVAVTVVEPVTDAKTFTWDLSKASYASASETSVKWVDAAATMETVQAEGATACNNYLGGEKTSTRFYKGNSLTFTPSAGVTIVKVTYTATTNGYATALASSTWTNASASASVTEVTILPTDGTTAFSAVLGGTTGATGVTVYYTGTPSGDQPATATLASIAVSGQKTDFTVGDTFTHDGAVVTATYSDGTTKHVTSSAEFSTPDMTTAGTKTVTVSYTENEVTKTTTYEITVAEAQQLGEGEYSFTITVADFNSESYAANNGEHTSTATTSNGQTKTITWKSNQVMNQSSVMQWQKNNGYIYNSTDLGTR